MRIIPIDKPRYHAKSKGPEKPVDPDEMTIELRLAAIVMLLSSSALRGATARKTEALRHHLQFAATSGEPLDASLQAALDHTLADWRNVECHPRSVPCDALPLGAPGQSLH